MADLGGLLEAIVGGIVAFGYLIAANKNWSSPERDRRVSNRSARLLKEAHFRYQASLTKFFGHIADTDLPILDDFGMKALEGQQLLDFLELIENRHGKKATIISQLPVADWYDVLQGNTTAADASPTESFMLPYVLN